MKYISTLLVVCVCLIGIAQTPATKEESKPTPDGEVSTTQQTVKINGVTIPLTAKAGTLQLRDENNNPIALFGFTSYTKDAIAGAASTNRPIIFSYNGGPGSSSYWLHMGVMGPKRIVVNDPTNTPAAPYKIVNNEF
jgi:carboxypeptidase C (cathepsin A)